MAPPLVVANAGILKLRWSNGTRSWLNVIGIMGSPTMPNITQPIADDVSGLVGATLASGGVLSLLATTTLYDGASIRSIVSPNLPEFVSVSGAVAGAGTGDVLPLSVAASATFRTALAGKSFRGRTYFSGFTETQNDAAGRSVAAVNTAIQAFLNELNNGLKARSMQLGVVSRPADQVVIPEKIQAGRTGQANAVTTVDMRTNRWESQRRRTGRT